MKYRTLVADPPWPYRWTGDSTSARSIKYPTMGMLEIAELPVSSLAANEAHLYLWITADFNRRGEGSRLVQWWRGDQLSEARRSVPVLVPDVWARHRVPPRPHRPHQGGAAEARAAMTRVLCPVCGEPVYRHAGLEKCYERARQAKRRADERQATSLDDRRSDCRCEPWAQRWRPESPHRCVNCGGLFPPHTVAARR